MPFDRQAVLAGNWTREGEAYFDRASANVEARTAELAFSSQSARIRRMYGFEILSHAPGAVNLDRLNSGRANLLWHHDPKDYLGVIESARIDDKSTGRATVRFGTSPRARELFADVMAGIIGSVSVGYHIDDIKLTRAGDAGEDEYTVTNWTPIEISLVTVPADDSVGIGRSALPAAQPAQTATPQEQATMDGTTAPAGHAGEIQVIDNSAKERLRIQTLYGLAKTHKIEDAQRDQWVNDGLSDNDAARVVLDVIAERAKHNPQVSHVGLSPTETRSYSIIRAINAVVSKNWNKAGVEAEASRDIAQRLGKHPNENTFFVPAEIQKRDLIVGTSTMGGYLVSTGNQSFIELLRNRSVVYQMGATRLSGLVGSVTIPKQTSPGTGYWLATEATSITESQQVFGQLALTPKNLGAYTEISRQLLLQSSPDAENLVNSDLAKVLALALDVAALRGTGTEQPTGIVNTANIGGVTITTGVVTYANAIEFQTDAAAGNALASNSGYVTTPAIAGFLMTKQRFTSTDTPLWNGNVLDGTVVGMKAMASNQMTAGQLLFGDFSQVIIGEWGVLEVEANPYANFAAGIIGVRAFLTADVGVRYPVAFSLATGITA